MKKQAALVLIVALGLTATGAAVVGWLKSNQRLGKPGLKTEPIPGDNRLNVMLPAHVLNYDSKWIEVDPVVTNTLPKDTSYGQRAYVAPDGFSLLANVVLMGADRTSIHKPQFCLTSQGWTIDKSELTRIPIAEPHRYELPVMKLTTTKQVVLQGQPVTVRGVYVYWFVADRALTAEHWERMWWMARHIVHTGELQRWAYVTAFAVCEPGQEDAVYARMKDFIAAAVPQFQLVEGAPPTVAAAPSSLP